MELQGLQQHVGNGKSLQRGTDEEVKEARGEKTASGAAALAFLLLSRAPMLFESKWAAAPLKSIGAKIVTTSKET